MRTIHDPGHDGAVGSKHVVKVTMHPLDFLMIVQPKVDPTLIGDHHHDPTCRVRCSDRLRNTRQHLEVSDPCRVSAEFPVDHTITIQEQSFPHSSKSYGAFKAADVQQKVGVQRSGEQDPEDGTIEVRVMCHVVTSATVHVPGIDQIQATEQESR